MNMMNLISHHELIQNSIEHKLFYSLRERCYTSSAFFNLFIKVWFNSYCI